MRLGPARPVLEPILAPHGPLPRAPCCRHKFGDEQHLISYPWQPEAAQAVADQFCADNGYSGAGVSRPFSLPANHIEQVGATVGLGGHFPRERGPQGAGRLGCEPLKGNTGHIAAAGAARSRTALAEAAAGRRTGRVARQAAAQGWRSLPRQAHTWAACCGRCWLFRRRCARYSSARGWASCCGCHGRSYGGEAVALMVEVA